MLGHKKVVGLVGGEVADQHVTDSGIENVSLADAEVVDTGIASSGVWIAELLDGAGGAVLDSLILGTVIDSSDSGNVQAADIVNGGSTLSTTQDEESSVNIYGEAGTVKIQNLTGAAAVVSLKSV